MSEAVDVDEEVRVMDPYPGLRPFERTEHEIFFGRGEQVDQMLTSLEEKRFLAVVGSSGCGKSSLVRAGLLPAIADGYLAVPWEGTEREVKPWRFVLMRPGNSPFRRMAEAIQEAAGDDPEAEPDPQAVAFTEATLRSGPNGFHEAITDAGLGGEVPVLLLVDQFEELFRLSDREMERGEGRGGVQGNVRDETVAFVNLLLSTAAQGDHFVPVILTMRSDWIGRCDAFQGLPEAVSGSQFLTPRMTRGQMRDAILGPLSVFDATAEPALVNRILNEVGTQMDQLPLMQHALMRTWHAAQRRWAKGGGGRILTEADYEGVGGFSEALSMHLEEAWGELAEDEGRERIVRHLFLLLSEPGKSGGELTRRMATVQEAVNVAETSVEEVAELVNVFQRDHRNFVVVSPAGNLDDDSLLDISHEALLRQWKRLQRWVKEEAESAERYGDLARAAQQWEKGEAAPWRPPQLNLGLNWRKEAVPTKEWAERYGGGFSLAMKFLDASQDEYQGETSKRAEQERKLKRTRLVIWAITVPLLVLMVVVGYVLYLNHKAASARDSAASARDWALREMGFADEARRKAQRITFALKAIETSKRQPELGLLLAMEAASATFLEAERTNDPDRKILPPQSEVEMALRTTVGTSLIRQRFEGHSQPVYSVDIDPKGERLVTGAFYGDGTVRVWDLKTGKLIHKPIRHLDPSKTDTFGVVRFDRSGNRILTGSRLDNSTYNSYLCEWREDAGEWKQEILFKDRPEYETAMALNQDGSLLASGNEGKGTTQPITLWRMNNGGRDGAGNQEELAAGPTRVRVLGGEENAHTKRVTSLTFSADGRRLLSTSFDGRAVLWKLRPSISDLTPTLAQNANVRQSFSKLLLVASNALASSKAVARKGDHSVRELPDGSLQISSAHGDGVEIHGGDLSPNGTKIATVGNDSALRIWDAGNGGLLAETRHPSPVMAVKFLDDTHIATGCSDSQTRVWELVSVEDRNWAGHTVLFLQLEAVIKGHEGRVRDLATSADGRLIATASADKTALLWKRPPGVEVSALEEQSMEFWAAAIHAKKAVHARKGEVTVYAGTKRGFLVSADGNSGRLLTTSAEPVHAGSIRSVDVDSTGSLIATASEDGRVRVLDAATGELRWLLPGSSGVGSPEEGGKPEAGARERGPGTVYHARFSGDGTRLVTASNDGSARVFDTRTWQQLADLRIPYSKRLKKGEYELVEWPRERGPNPAIYDASFSPGGDLVVTADFVNGTATIFEVETGKWVSQIGKGHGQEHLLGAAFDPGGNYLATASADGNCIIWKPADDGEGSNATEREQWRRTEFHVSLSHGAAVRSVEFSPLAYKQARLLLTAASDGVARLWELPGFKLRCELRGHSEVITGAKFSSDGEYIVTSGRDGTVRVYYTDPWSVYQLATSRVTRKLTLSEREEFGVIRPLSEGELEYYAGRVKEGKESGELLVKEKERKRKADAELQLLKENQKNVSAKAGPK